MIATRRPVRDGDPREAWRLTPLGMVLVASLACSLLLGAYTVVRRGDAGRTDAPAPVSAPATPGRTGPNSRVFSGADAVDHARLTYDTYLVALAAGTPASRQPPYAIDEVLRRLEAVRPMLSPTLFGSLQAAYRERAALGPIERDEFLCSGPADATSVNAVLQTGGRDVAVVSIGRVAGQTFEGSFTVTVDLSARKVTQIACDS